MELGVASTAASDAFPAGAITASIQASIAARCCGDRPFRHAILEGLLPHKLAAALAELPLPPPKLDGISGTREQHNATRCYADAGTMRRFPMLARLAEVLQSTTLARTLQAAFGAALEGTFLRLEYAQDVDGFWLAPHTDLGVKRFTGLIYLSRDAEHAGLGTDLYWDEHRHFGPTPFRANCALAFVPAADTWHGFERRVIPGIRRSLIVNYVSAEWRAREQLSFPERCVTL